VLNAKSRQILFQATGFTLNEVLITLGITSIGLLGFAAGTSTIIRHNHLSTRVTVATALAQDKLEQLKSNPLPNNFNNCDAAPIYGAAAEIGITSSGGPGGGYNRCWTIGDSGVHPWLKKVDVTVSWNDDMPRNVKISTLFYAGQVQ